MVVRRLRTLALEIFKTLNDLNPAFIKNLSAKWEVSERKKNNLEIPNRKTVRYRDKIVRSLGPHKWNGLPGELKNENSYGKFKEYFNAWYGPKCTCSLCSFTEISKMLETKMLFVKYFRVRLHRSRFVIHAKVLIFTTEFWTFSRWDKMIKIIGIISGSVMSYLNTWALNYFNCVAFLALILFILFTMELTNFKKPYSWI